MSCCLQLRVQWERQICTVHSAGVTFITTSHLSELQSGRGSTQRCTPTKPAGRAGLLRPLSCLALFSSVLRSEDASGKVHFSNPWEVRGLHVLLSIVVRNPNA